jgi:hypothetical protein
MGHAALPQLYQESFRARNDNGPSEVDPSSGGASWIAATDTGWDQVPDKNFRVRFVVSSDLSFSSGGQWMHLGYSLNGAPYVFLGLTSSVIKTSPTDYWTNHSPTTDWVGRVGSDTLFADTTQMLVDGDSGDAFTEEWHWYQGEVHGDFKLQYETEYSLQIVGADVSVGDKIDIRVFHDTLGAFPEGYLATPRITVVAQTAPTKSVVANAFVRVTKDVVGVETYTVDCGGLTPKGCLFIASHNYTLDVKDASLNSSISATDGVTSWAYTHSTRDDAPTSVVAATFTPRTIMIMNDSTNAYDAYGEFDSFGPDSVSISWSGIPDQSYWLQIIAFAGDDVQCHAGSFITSQTLDVEVPVTGVGFEADFVWWGGTSFGQLNYAGVRDNSNNHGIILNDRAGGITQNSFYNHADSGSAISDWNSEASEKYGRVSGIDAYTFGINQDHEMTSFNSDGWGYTPRNFASLHSLGHFSVSFGVDAPDIQIWSGWVDSPTSTGVTSYTQPGFEPQFLLAAHSGSAVLQDDAIHESESGTFGFSTHSPSVQACISQAAENDADTMNTQSISSSQSIRLHAGDQTESFVATLDGMTTQGWDWNFTKTLGTVRKWLVLAFGTGIPLPNNLDITASINVNPALSAGPGATGLMFAEHGLSTPIMAEASVEVLGGDPLATVAMDLNGEPGIAPALTADIELAGGH